MKNPNGYGSIVKLNGARRKPYAVRKTIGWTEHGSAKYKYLGYYATYKDAKRALFEFNKNPYDVDNPTLEEVWRLYEKDIVPTLTGTTALSRQVGYNHLEDIHKIPISEIRAIDIQRCVNKFTSPSAQGNIRRTFVAIEDYARKCDLITKQVGDLVDVKKYTVKRERHIFEDDEINALWEMKDIPIVADALILLYSGWRIGEYLNMKKSDVTDGYMRSGSKTEAGKNRRVPIHPKIYPLLREKLKHGASEYVCAYHVQSSFRNKWSQIDILSKHVIHECRHTFRTRLDNAGANKVCIDLLMGHASKDVGERVYTHKTLEQLRETLLLLK